MDKAHALGAFAFVVILVSLVRSFLPSWMRSDKSLWPFSFDLTDYVKSGDLPPNSVDGHHSHGGTTSSGGSCIGGDGSTN